MFDERLIPEFAKFVSMNRDFTWWNYVGVKSDLFVALSFSRLFAPEIVVYDDCFLLKDGVQFSIADQWRERHQTDDVAFETNVNRHCVGDMFIANETTPYPVALLGAFASELKMFWELTFEMRYPDAELTVETYFDQDDRDWYITVYSRKHRNTTEEGRSE